MKNLKPGQTAPKSGQYVTITPSGNKGKEITSTKGNPLPPSSKPGTTYVLVDPTKNKSNR